MEGRDKEVIISALSAGIFAQLGKCGGHVEQVVLIRGELCYFGLDNEYNFDLMS